MPHFQRWINTLHTGPDSNMGSLIYKKMTVHFEGFGYTPSNTVEIEITIIIMVVVVVVVVRIG